MQNHHLMRAIRFLFKIIVVFLLLSPNAVQAQTHTSEKEKRDQIAKGTRQLMEEFLVHENIEKMAALLDDSMHFYWPNKTIMDKSQIVNVCQALVDHNDSKVELIDLVIEGNTGFILFVWTAKIEKDDNPNLLGKEFSVHDCWRVKWEDDKIIEWYTIWGSQDRLEQLGYEIEAP